MNAGTLLAQSNFPGLDPADPGQIYWEQIYRTDRWKDPAIEARFAGKLDRYGRPEWNGPGIRAWAPAEWRPAT